MQTRPNAPGAPTLPFRADIEGLRAIAVIAVLLFHGDLGPFSGGYVGVDVFFVVSGFLITHLLVRDLTADGVRALPTFWARRVRRLLPASCLVIVATLLVARSLFDPVVLRSLAGDATAAGLFVVNFVFAGREGDYFAAELAPSPLLHFWSLAVEEQFYVIWPIVLLTVVRVGRRRTPALLALIGGLWVASFLASVIISPTNGSWAFYLLPTRAWELLTGAALAIAGPPMADRLLPHVRSAIGWLGVGGVMSAFLFLGTRTDFPGWIALWPVAATAAIVFAGIDSVAHGPERLLSWPPLVWIGRRSYGIYLWHWPTLVLAAAAAGPLSVGQRVATLIGTVGLAAVTYTVIENPVRYSARLAGRPSRALLVGAALVLVVATAATGTFDSRTTVTAEAIAPPARIVVPDALADTPISPATPDDSPPAVPPPGTGGDAAPAGNGDPVTDTPATPATDNPATDTPASDDPAADTQTTEDQTTTETPAATATTTSTVPDLRAAVQPIVTANRAALARASLIQDVPPNLQPSVWDAADDKPAIYQDGCILSDRQIEPPPCVFGDPVGSIDVVLFGDSHAAQWFPAMQQIADARGYRMRVMTKKGCPTAAVPLERSSLEAECVEWRSAVVAQLAADPADVLVMSATHYDGGVDEGLDPDETWRVGLESTLAALRPHATEVVVLGDTPTPLMNVPSCLSDHRDDVERCVTPREQAVRSLRLGVERDVAARHDAAFAPTSDWLCTDVACPVIMADVLLYRDNNHLTTTASSLFAPYIAATLAAAIP